MLHTIALAKPALTVTWACRNARNASGGCAACACVRDRLGSHYIQTGKRISHSKAKCCHVPCSERSVHSRLATHNGSHRFVPLRVVGQATSTKLRYEEWKREVVAGPVRFHSEAPGHWKSRLGTITTDFTALVSSKMTGSSAKYMSAAIP